MRNGSGYQVGQKAWDLSEFICPNIGFLFYCCLYKVLFSFLRAAFEFRIPRWIMEVFFLLRHLYYFLKSVDIRREERKRAFIRLFIYQLTVWYLQKCSFVFLMYFIIRRLHKNEQNLENRGCVENGCVTSDVRTVLGFVHVTWMTVFTERTTVGFNAV